MKRPKHFYYITHKDDLKSILKKGIFSRSKAGNILSRILKPKITSIHSPDIIQNRKSKRFKGRSLWDYANVYFQARNPMLFRVKEKFKPENLVVLQISSDILEIPGAGVTDGNAASQNTVFFEEADKGLSVLNAEQFEREYWSQADDSKRKIMAEVLIPDHIPKEKIIGVYAASSKTADQIRKDITGSLNIMPSPYMFFLPAQWIRILNKLFLAKGDMFFSKMQTFTISVNTVGIMGKGLASRAKYQFPDAYVLYQDICRQKKLKMGVPYLYKREENYEKTLFEDVIHESKKSIVTENGSRWFLLFPTKSHWREQSPISGIEKGLQWLSENYKSQGIQSLAMPALGCGLGGLDWKDIGPLMCKYLSQMEIQSCIYLPLEKQLPPEQLKPEFLLKDCPPS